MSYDVVIVGASVAGNTAALECAKRGLKTLVIERSDPEEGYRIKPCGGGLSPITIEEFPQTKEFIVHETKELVNRFENIELVCDDISIYMSNRNELDLGLAEVAQSEGAEYHFGEVWTPQSPYESEWLIGAGGATCPVARSLNYQRAKVPIKVAYFDKPKWNDADQSEFMFYDGLMGYGWVFPKGGFIDIGLGGFGTGTEVKRLYDIYLKHHGCTGKPIWQAGWQIPMTWYPEQRQIFGNKILIGDAGNFVNPATGEGILPSMRSAREAAMVIAGELPAEDYPTFRSHMVRLQKMRDEIEAMSVGDFFRLGEENKKLFDEVIEFFFLEKPAPTLPKRSEEEKIELYQQLLSD